jgi:hypothetical protein
MVEVPKREIYIESAESKTWGKLLLLSEICDLGKQ